MSKQQSKVFLGKHQGERLSIEKHRWDCEWYWAFGYIGNRNLHTHFEGLITANSWCSSSAEFDRTDVESVFDGGRPAWLTQDRWWILRDLFISAYALKEAAAVYQHGGHQTGQAAPYRVTSKDRAAAINADLGELLNTIWNLLEEWSA